MEYIDGNKVNKVEISDIVNFPLLGDSTENVRFYNFFPKKSLLPNKHYKIHLSDNIEDMSGNHLKETVFEFTTGAFIRPEIQLKAPRENSSDVSQNPSIEFNISSENEDIKNVDSDHVYLLDLDNKGQTKIKLYIIKGDSNNNYTATVNDEKNPVLLANRKYAIVFSSDISDSDGNQIAPDVKFIFTTGRSIVPDISMISPVNNAFGVSQKPILSFHIGGAVGNVNNADSDTIYLVKDDDPTNKKITLTVIANGDGLANNFTAILADSKAILDPDKTYNLVFSDDIVDSFGNHITKTTYHFTTGESALPQAYILSPTKGATNITKHPLIQIMFSTTVNLTKNNNVLLLDDKGDKVTITDIDYFSEKKVGDITYKNVYTFSPADELNPKKVYTIKLTTDITDTEDKPNHLKETTFNFTTGVKNTPTAGILQPGNGETGVSVSQLIKVRFSTPVQGASNDTVQLHEDSPTGAVVTPILPLNSTDNTVFTMHPPLLNPVKNYYVTFSEKISSADTDDHLVNTPPVHFTTGNSKSATVQLVFPKAGQEQVSIRTTVKITFSTPVKNVSSTTVTLTNCKNIGSESYTFTMSPNDGYRTDYELTPINSLPSGQKICVNIKYGILDSANTPVDISQLSFKTGDKVVPTVDLTSGVSSVAVDSKLELTFSSSMKNVQTNISIHKGTSTSSSIVDFDISDVGNKVYTLTPKSQLDYETSYYIVINSGITDNDGNPLPEKYIVFTTAKNTPPPPPLPDYILCTQNIVYQQTDDNTVRILVSGFDSCWNYSKKVKYSLSQDLIQKAIAMEIDGNSITCKADNKSDKCILTASGISMDHIMRGKKLIINWNDPYQGDESSPHPDIKFSSDKPFEITT